MTIQIRRTATPDNPPPGLMPGQLAVEMASSPPRLWCGVPYEINPSGRVEIGRSTAAAESEFDTGDVKLTLKIVADPGWVMMDDGYIGNAGANTPHGGDAYEPLYRLLWAILPDSPAPVGYIHFPDGKSDVETDWSTNRRVALPRQLGRALIVAGHGAGLTDRALGAFFGEERHAPIATEMFYHNHAVYDPTHSHSASPNDHNALSAGYHIADASPPSQYIMNWGGTDSSWVVQANYTGVSTYNNGSSAPFNVMQPSAGWNVMMKL